MTRPGHRRCSLKEGSEAAGPATDLERRPNGLNPTLGALGRSGDGFVWSSSSDEALWRLVGVGKEEVDGGVKVDHALKDAALGASFGEDGEESLDGVEPAGTGRREVEGPARVTPNLSRSSLVEPLDALAVLRMALAPQEHMQASITDRRRSWASDFSRPRGGPSSGRRAR